MLSEVRICCILASRASVDFWAQISAHALREPRAPALAGEPSYSPDAGVNCSRPAERTNTAAAANRMRMIIVAPIDDPATLSFLMVPHNARNLAHQSMKRIHACFTASKAVLNARAVNFRAMWKRVALGASVFLALATDAQAMEFSFDAYVDVRLVVPPDEVSWLDGGLGKTRFGGNQPSPNFRFAEAAGQGTLAITDDLHAVTVLRIEPKQTTGVDILEAYLSWRPRAEGAWRWSVKAGAFFPPISVENDDLGWASPYTLTPAAINSWVGNELRTLGGQADVAWSGGYGTLTAIGALYCCNVPAGVLIADRGWTLDDRPMGLLDRVRIPDATATLFGMPFPSRTVLFENIDDLVGWYTRLKWDVPVSGELAVLWYDIIADPETFTTRDASKQTHNKAASLKAHPFGITILAQGMTGDTAIESFGYHYTDFDSAFLLLC